LENFQCTEGDPTLASTCEPKLSARISACSDPGTFEDAEAEHFEDYCRLLEICQGEDNFEGEYGDLAGCVDEYEEIFSDFSGRCEDDASQAVFCDIENFQCTDGESVIPDECMEDYQEFNEECDL
jgi:hypothetical protein